MVFRQQALRFADASFYTLIPAGLLRERYKMRQKEKVRERAMPEPRVQADHCDFLARGDCRVFALKHREEEKENQELE